MKTSSGYAYDAISATPTRAMQRWMNLPSFRKAAIMRAVEAGELTQREICLEFRCSPLLVQAARIAMSRRPTNRPHGY